MSGESEMMKKYGTFQEYLKTRPTYDEIRQGVVVNPIAVDIETRLTLNLPVSRREPIVVTEYPLEWAHYFKECESELNNALGFVNYQIKLGKNVYPKREDLFRAFTLIKPRDVRVIIIGQDPYHTRGVANGIAFSCNGEKIQSSLVNVFNEIERTEGGRPETGRLEHWLEQGVLPINLCFTVNEGEPKSHGDAWKAFFYKLMNLLLLDIEYCFLCLWGAEAQKLVDGRDKLTISTSTTMVLKAGHPSGLNKTNPFVGCGHFKEINDILKGNDLEPIDWVGNKKKRIPDVEQYDTLRHK